MKFSELNRYEILWINKLNTHSPRGYNLTGSHNHPVLTIAPDESGKPAFIWKTLEQLKEGDYAAISYGNMIFGKQDMSCDEAYWYGFNYKKSIEIFVFVMNQ